MNSQVIFMILLAVFCGFGEAWAAGEDCGKASALVREAVEATRDNKKEIELYQQAIAACPEMAEAHHNLGLALLKSGKPDEAIKSLEQALKVREQPAFRVSLAAAYLQTGKLDLALEHYQKALSADPGNLTALQGLAIAQQRSGDVSAAKETLEKALAIKKSDPNTSYNLGAIYFSEHQYQKAIDQFAVAAEFDSENANALFLLGLSQLRLKNYSDARESLNRGLGKFPRDVRFSQALGQLYSETEDFEKAELALRKSLSIVADDRTSMINLGVVLIMKHQEGLAEELLNRVISQYPGDAKALGALGWAQLELGKYRDAEASLKKSLEIDPGDASVINNLGVLFERLGRDDEAKEQFSRAKTANPTLSEASENHALYETTN